MKISIQCIVHQFVIFSSLPLKMYGCVMCKIKLVYMHMDTMGMRAEVFHKCISGFFQTETVYARTYMYIE